MVSLAVMATQFATVCLVALTLWRMQGATALPHLGREGHALSKRNAWWSKKASGFGPSTDLLDDENNLPLIVDVACYVEDCVPDLLFCANQATTGQGYDQCKLQHRLCVSRCFHGIS